MIVQKSEILKLLKENSIESIEKIINYLEWNSYFSTNNRDEMVSWIVDEINNNNSVFMHYLAAWNKIELFKEFLEKGAKLDILSNKKNIPLHWAVKEGNAEIVKLILKNAKSKHHGEKMIFAENNEGKTPFEMAIEDKNEKKYGEIYELIREYIIRKYPEKLETKLENLNIEKKNVESSETILNKNPSNSSNTTYAEAPCVINNYKWALQPTGQIQWKDLSNKSELDQNVSGMRWGSGVLIGKYFFTAGHCVDKCEDPKGWSVKWSNSQTEKPANTPLKPEELIQYMTVNFNYQFQICGNYNGDNGTCNETKFRVKKLIEHREGKLDYAILKLGKLGKKSQYEMKFVYDDPQKHNEILQGTNSIWLDQGGYKLRFLIQSENKGKLTYSITSIKKENAYNLLLMYESIDKQNMKDSVYYITQTKEQKETKKITVSYKKNNKCESIETNNKQLIAFFKDEKPEDIEEKSKEILNSSTKVKDRNIFSIISDLTKLDRDFYLLDREYRKIKKEEKPKNKSVPIISKIISPQYNLFLMSIKKKDKLPDFSKRTSDQLPVLVKQENNVHIYGRTGNNVLSYTTLDMSKLKGLQFPTVKGKEICIDKSKVSEEVYNEISLKKGHTNSKELFKLISSYSPKQSLLDIPPANLTEKIPNNREKVVISQHPRGKTKKTDDGLVVKTESDGSKV